MDTYSVAYSVDTLRDDSHARWGEAGQCEISL